MLTIEDVRVMPVASRSASTNRLPAPRRRHLANWLLPVLVVVLAVGLRLVNLTSSYDLFIDEPFYVTLGQSVAAGHMPFAAGSLFFLHPPGHALLVALWIRTAGGVSGSIIEQVFALRYLNVLFAAATSLLLYLIGRRLSDPTAGLIAAILFAVSPWFIRQNSFVLLETSTLTFVLAGFLALLFLPSSTRRRRVMLVLIGLSFGYGILIKEFAVFVTMVPMVLIAWRRPEVTPRHRKTRAEAPILRRSEAALVIAAACVPYGIWCLVIVMNGDFAQFWTQTTSGFRRASGLQKISGFNQTGTPSFVSTILANMSQFWTTYLLMGLGAVCSIYLLRQGSARLRVLGAFAFGSLPLLGYSVVFGANEEQFYYYLLIPSALAVGVSGRQIWRWASPWLRRIIVVLAVVWLASDLTNWAIVHTTPDNETQQVDDWMRDNVPNGTAVAVTDSVQREIFLRYRMVNDDSPTALNIAGGVSYLVVFQKEVAQGYAFIGPEGLSAQIGHRKPVFTAYGRGSWSVDVYDLR
jgi:4-amino-4-deoxy-L-arabinose transferase-like glycosyltransferase